jgi:hypothetical protein
VVTVLLTDAGGVVTKYVQTFSTMTDDLLRLDAWLAQLDVTEVAMESTGVFGYPIYNLIEAVRSITLLNAQLHSTPADSGLARAGPLPQTSYCQSVPKKLIGCRKCWKGPISNWQR